MKGLSTKVLTTVLIACGVFLIGYAAAHWPSWEAYFFLAVVIVGFAFVGITWRQRVRYLRRMEEERKLVRESREKE